MKVLDETFPIVVLACSTGGLDALTRVLAPLPAAFPAAVVVVQHMAPNGPGMLPWILAARTALPVDEAFDGVALRPGRILVAPPGEHLLATTEGTIATIPVGSTPPYRPSADLLLATLAAVAGPRVIAVVLSGYGTDGAIGASAVHRCGGLVLAADPATAMAPSMPEAVIARNAIVDHVVDVDEIAEALVALTADDIEPAAG